MYISLWQSLPPYLLFGNEKNGRGTVYPFGQPRQHCFYYARSGVYHLALKLNRLGLRKVLFPAYNHGVEVAAMLAGGEELICYNILPSGDIDYDDLEGRITPGTRVLYIIHYNGFPQDMDAVMALKKKYDLVLIEDVALSMFARHGDKYVGEFGEASIFSLYKTFAIPNGGMLVVNRPEFDIDVNLRHPARFSSVSRLGNLSLCWLAENVGGIGRRTQRIRSGVKMSMAKLRLGRVPVGDARFDESLCDWGMSGLSRRIIGRSDVGEIVRIRRDNFEHMQEVLKSVCPGVEPMYRQLPAGAVPLFFPVLVDDRERIHRSLLREGVETSMFWRDWHPGIPAERFPAVQSLRERVLELPIHQSVSPGQIEYLAEKLKAVLARLA